MSEKLKQIGKSVTDNKFSNNLFVRYFIFSILIIIVCFSILGFALLVFVGNYWKNEKTEIVTNNVSTIADTTSEVLSSNRMKNDTEGSLVMLCNNLRIVSRAVNADFFIVGTDGKVILCQDSLASDFRRTDGEVPSSGSCRIHSSYDFSDELLNEVRKGSYCKVTNLDGMFSSRVIVAAQAITVKSETVAYSFCIQPLEQGVSLYVLDVLKMFLFASAVALLLCFIAVYIMTYSLTKPFRQMSYATKRYSVGDFSPRVDVRGRDELASLCAEFNSMATALATLESTRRSFVANVSHELKTPMTTIGGYIDAILDGTIPKEKEQQYLQIVSDEVKRLSRLVVAMLNLSKIEAGEIQIHRSKFDITELIFSTLLSFEQTIDNRNIQIKGLEELLPVTVSADKDMLHQAVYNLVDNAVKFTPDGGWIELKLTSNAKTVSVSIANSGAGVSSEEISKIFERFYKVDKSRSYDVKGAGLGLYIVKTVIEMHSGEVSARSEEGKFTEFTFTIPIGGF